MTTQSRQRAPIPRASPAPCFPVPLFRIRRRLGLCALPSDSSRSTFIE